MNGMELPPSPSILVLQHVACETLGTIEGALRAVGLGYRTIRIFDAEPVPRELGDARGLIAMGGPMSVYDHVRLPHLADEMRLIEAALHANRPVLGVCLGSQLLARVLGGNVRSSGRLEIGWHRVRLSHEAQKDWLWQGAPADFEGFHWHGDVFDLPKDCVQLASSELTACQAFRYRDRAYGILFHMEVDVPLIEAMAAHFGADLAQAGRTLEDLRNGAAQHLATLSAIGERFFRGWANLAASEQ